MTTQAVGFKLEITMNAAWQVGTGLSRGLLDRTTYRNAYGEVYIPASTIKGRLRNACENIARLYYKKDDNQLKPCQPPSPQSMCRGSKICIICRLFGSAYVGERLFFEDAALSSELREIYEPADVAQVRTRIKLDRRYGVAEKGHLFSTEYAESALSFHANISGNLELTPVDGDTNHPYELILLAAGVRMVKELGGDKSAGFGACNMAISGNFNVGETQVEPAELIKNWLEYLEFYGAE
jgi:CRISPR/Cas system CSM-associated protein Csm3 (group 7 of RAMP superfamily)